MHKLRVADINLLIKYKYDTMLKQAKFYETEFEKPQVTINIPDETLEEWHKESPHLTIDDIEYVYTGASFYEALLHFNGFMLHSSGVVKDGYAYLFSADPGTGKSTHTALWQKHFGEDNARIINDDKPAIRLVDNRLWVYGTPWSGKTDKNLNIKVPLGAIVFLERAEDNWVRQIEPKDAIPLVMQQTIRPSERDRMILLLDMLDRVLSSVKLYRLGCNISEEAAEVSYNGIKVEE